LLNGADGILGGLPKRAALTGHASVGELLANLARIGNRNLQAFRIDRLLPLATEPNNLLDLYRRALASQN
jgi:hypothetical protein